MVELIINSNTASVSVSLLEAPKRVLAAIPKAFATIGQRLVGWVKTEKLQGTPLNYRTRTLSRSIFMRLEGEGENSKLYVGADISKAPYARLQEFGGVVRPTRSQFLTIPVGVNLTGNGVMRVSPREFISNPSALGFERSFVNRRRTAIMGAAKGGRVEPVFALKTEIRLPERSYLRSTVDEKRAEIFDLFAQRIVAALNQSE